eukprot:TRINITY_DN9872_c0_g1_i1.p1 TRINITY_DN9872_c0_g1~~TRINITY_DN9872_c0_g1_i1.p1  ORF type:complete len:2093 (+),score=590.96 TRINITY_DN9872_c0_g1_i1:41-6319(+)
MEAGTLKDELVSDIVKLLGDAYHYPGVFESLAQQLVTPDVAVRSVGFRHEGLSESILLKAFAKGLQIRVTVELIETALGDGHFRVAVLLLTHAPAEVLTEAYAKLRFRPPFLKDVVSPGMTKLIPGACTSLLHLAVVMNAHAVLHRLLAAPQLVPHDVRAGLPSFTVMMQPSLLVDLYTPPLLAPPNAFCTEEQRKWSNHTRLSPLHWVLCLPDRGDLVPYLLRQLGPNQPVSLHSRLGLLGSAVRNWCVTEKVDVLAPCPDTLGIVEELHPVAMPVAFLSPKLEPLSDEERIVKMLDVLHAPGLVLDIHSIVFALECMLRRQLWGETGAARPVYEALFQCLPAGAKVPLHHALPLGMNEPDAVLRRTSFFVNHLLDAFAPSLDLNGCNESGMAPIHVAAYYSSMFVAEALLTQPGLDVGVRSRSLVAPGTVLNIAAAHGNQEIVFMLLKHRAVGTEAFLMERELRSKRAPLHHACERLHFSTASMLADRCGADMSDLQSVPSLLTPAHHLFLAGLRSLNENGASDAFVSSIDAVACRLLSAKSFALPDRQGDTPLHLACRIGCIDYVKGASHNYPKKFKEAVVLRNAKGETILHHCANALSPGVADLVRVVTDVTPRAELVEMLQMLDHQGNTALHAALRSKYAPGVLIASLLAIFPIDSSAYGVYHGATALATPSAIANLPAEEVQKLVFHDKSGRNALHYFADAGDVASLQACVMKVPNVAEVVAVRDRKGDSILHQLLQHPEAHGATYAEKVLRELPMETQKTLLLSIGSGGRGLVHLAAANGARAFLDYALSVLHGLPWCFESDAGDTPSGEALRAHDPALAWLLWRREMTKTPLDEDRRDILLQTAAEGDMGLFQDVLSTVGLVDFTVRDGHGNNVVHCCAEDIEHGSAKLAALAARGVLCFQDFNTRNDRNETPLQVAAENDLGDGVAVLVGLGVEVRPADLMFPVRYGFNAVVLALLKGQPIVPPGVLEASVMACDASTTICLSEGMQAGCEDDLVAALTTAHHYLVLSGDITAGGLLPTDDAAVAVPDHSALKVVSHYERRRRQRGAASRARRVDVTERSKQMFALLKKFHPVSESSKAVWLLMESVENWFEAAKSSGDTIGCVAPEDYVDILLQKREVVSEVREAGWFKLFSLLIIAGMLRAQGNPLGDWRDSTAKLSAFGDLPPVFQARCPVLHRAVLVLFAVLHKQQQHGREAVTTAEKAFAVVTRGMPGHETRIVSAMFHLPCFAPALTLLVQGSAAARRAVDSFSPAYLARLAVRESGRGGVLKVAVGRGDVPANIVQEYLRGWHMNDNGLLEDILSYRPDISEPLIRLLRDREMLNMRTTKGDNLMHLIMMTDEPSLLDHVDPGELDFDAVNDVGHTPADYCKSAAMMAALRRRGGEPQLSDIDKVEYVIALKDIVKPSFSSDPIGFLGNKIMRCVSCVLREAADVDRGREYEDRVRELEDRLVAQRVLIYKSPEGMPGVWGLHVPLRRAVEIAQEYGASTGGHGEGLDDSWAGGDEDSAIDRASFTKLQRILFLKIMLNPFRSGIDLVQEQEDGFIKGVFPVYLQDTDEALPIATVFKGAYPFNRLGTYLGVSRLPPGEKNPLWRVKQYCGENLAFYFAWLSVFEAWLVLPAVPAAVFLALQWVRGHDHPSMAIHAALMILWGVVYTKCWARREAEFGTQWGVYSRPTLETIRCTFRPLRMEDGSFMAEPNIFNPDLKDPVFPPAKRRPRYLLSFLSLAVWLGIAAVEFVVFVHLREYVQNASANAIVADETPPANATGTDAGDSTEASGSMLWLVLLSIGHTVAMIVIEKVYRVVSDVLTEFENHRYQRGFANSLIVKYMSLQLLTAFVPPMWIVYNDSRVFGSRVGFKNASVHVTVKLMSEATIGTVREYLLPSIMKWCFPDNSAKVAATVPRPWAALSEYARSRQGESYATDDFKVLYGEFSEIIMQMAYVICFASICPVGGLIALFNNYIEFRGDLNKMLHQTRRPLPDRARGVGSWAVLVKVIVALAVPINTFCLLQSPGFVDLFGYSSATVFLSVQVGFFIVYWVYHTAIPSTSYHTRGVIRRQEAQRDKKAGTDELAQLMTRRESKKTV